MDCLVHGVAKSRTQLSDFHTHVNTQNVIFCYGLWSSMSEKLAFTGRLPLNVSLAHQIKEKYFIFLIPQNPSTPKIQ